MGIYMPPSPLVSLPLGSPGSGSSRRASLDRIAELEAKLSGVREAAQVAAATHNAGEIVDFDADVAVQTLMAAHVLEDALMTVRFMPFEAGAQQVRALAVTLFAAKQ
jgi:hypothetical protein